MTKVMVRLGAASIFAVAGTAIGAGYSGLTPAATPLRTAAQEAGEYRLTIAAPVVDGSGGSFGSVNIYVPWILDSTDALQNSATAASVNGNLAAAISTFLSGTSDANATALVAGLGTTDAAGGAVGSNNVFLYEGRKIQHGIGFFLSDIASVIADDGRAVLSARFNSSFGQNNVDISGPGIYPPSNTGGITAGVTFNQNGAQLFDGSISGINATGSGGFLSTPSGALVDGADLLIGMVTFEGFTPLPPDPFPNAAMVYRYSGAPITGPAHQTPEWAWPQNSSPAPAGETSSDARQARPVLMTPDFGCATTDRYAMFGVGFSGSTPFSGSASNPMYLIVDRMPAGGAADGYADGFVYIDADGDNNPATANNDLRFVSGGQATGGGSFVCEGYDINAQGQVAAVLEDRTGSITIYQVLLYNPIINNCEITGYSAPIVIAESGQTFSDGITTIEPLFTTFENPPGTFNTDFINPFSGVSIDDNGRVAYSAAIEGVYDTSDPNGDVLIGSTTAIFVYDSATASTHKIVQGGQSGDVIPNIVSGPDIMLGRFGNDQESDMFHSNGMSNTGGFLAVAFRNGQGVGMGGGVLNPTGTPQSVRGVVTIELGAFTTVPTCPGDIAGPGGLTPDGQVDVDDLNAILSAFGTAVGMGDPRDTANNDGFVDVDDLNVILANFGCN